MAFCAKCGAQMADGTTFCGSCGASAGGAPVAAGTPVAAGSGSGLAPNVAGALAYVTIIPAILFLVLEPYNKDRFIRFHSFQCLFFAATMVVLSIAMMIVGFVLAFVPVIGWILSMLIWVTLWLGSLGLVIFLIYKAYQGERFMLPVIGKLADEQSSK